jgi:mannose-6-phosphate isomerase
MISVDQEKKMVEDQSQRPWGRYEILSEGDAHKVKTIWVNPGKRLSYQRHEKRAEHWFIVQGDARITLNGDTFEMGAGDSLDIEIGDLHRIENIGSTDVIFIEVQTGTYFGEDDIERIEDDFGR